MENSEFLEDENIEVDFQEEELELQNGHNTYAEFKKKIIKPALFIGYDNGRYYLNKEILDFIRAIDEELIIVITTGKCKTGKSYLSNLLLNSNKQNQESGFEVGNGTNQCTRGIWVWPELRKKENMNTKILFLDCEAISGGREPSIYAKNQILFLLFFISSAFINNSDSNIDNRGIEELNIFNSISDSFTLKGKTDKSAFLVESSPRLIWVLRDFTGDKLDPESKKEMSSKEYLDFCFRGKFSNDAMKTKEILVNLFPDRDSHTFVTPLKNGINATQLKTLNFDKLMNDFKQDFESFGKKIFRDLNCKKIKGKKLNGFTVANFIEEYIEKVNNAQIPEINLIWDNIIKKDIDLYYNRALNAYSNNLEKFNDVVEQDELIKYLYEYKLEAMMIFNKVFNLNQDTFNNTTYSSLFNNSLRNLESEISKRESKICDDNYNRSIKLCESEVQKCFEGIKDKMNDGYYNLKTTEEYIRDFENFLNSYNNKAKGPVKLRTLITFLTEKNPVLLERYISKLDEDNNSKEEQYRNTLEEMEKKKQNITKQREVLKQTTEEKEQKINELIVKNKKKSNEIDELNERIKQLELEIKKKQNNL